MTIDRKERAEAHRLKATIQVGKRGVTEDSIRETISQIKKRGMVKVKFNSSSEEIDSFIDSISENATLVMRRGRTIVFRKMR
ncbi:MAG: YhbY family RNA-binding protein [Thermoplasmata archaeon]|nr:YhbY family RNA-binding protein [Candidatus Sysuiplasma jiujiangense]MBX8638889.1 YhbY family RNA-binding protein [Candidatus Sysuiplasma jiujiangense]MBX8641050.1 YhbY family RNA-binding protein [Candidatus Sysuiplasma jiujiangense]